MQYATLIITIGCLLTTSVPAVQPAGTGTADREEVTFTFVDVIIEAGPTPLAAYQVELNATVGDVTFVGVEGGEHPAFAEPPYYDPKALTQDRLIIAAFNTGDDLPSGSTRVARIHVRIAGATPPDYDIKLTVAADSDGDPIAAAANVRPGDTE
jgi:hypothetical protein